MNEGDAISKICGISYVNKIYTVSRSKPQLGEVAEIVVSVTLLVMMLHDG